jgi:hypothetical protein
MSAPIRSAGGAGLSLTTLSTTGGTSRDTNAILSGSGWHMSGERVQVTATSQATARDGHREGACLLLDMPSGWAWDGTRALFFWLDDILWPSAAASTMWLGIGIVDPLANQAAQVGVVLGPHDQTGPAVRNGIWTAASGIYSAALGAAMTDMEGLIWPSYSGGALVAGRCSALSWSGVAGAKVPGADLTLQRTDAIPSTSKLALCAGFTGVAAGNQRTFGARIRVAVLRMKPDGTAVS